MNNAGAAAQDTAHSVPCHPHASREGARVPARACPRVLGASTAGTGGGLFPDAASFCSSPAGSDVTASRIARPARQRAELPRVPESPRTETSKPEILKHFTSISAFLPPLPAAASHFTGLQMAPVKVRKGEESRGEPQHPTRSFGQLPGCSAPAPLLPTLKCQRAILVKPPLPCSHSADIPETQTSQALPRMFFAAKHKMKAQKLKLVQVKRRVEEELAHIRSTHTPSQPMDSTGFSGLVPAVATNNKNSLGSSETLAVQKAQSALQSQAPNSSCESFLPPNTKHP